MAAANQSGAAASAKQSVRGSRPSSTPTPAVPAALPALKAVFTHAPARVRRPGGAHSSASRYAVVSTGPTKSPAMATSSASAHRPGASPVGASTAASVAPSSGSRTRAGRRQCTAPYTSPPTALPADSAASAQATAVGRPCAVANATISRPSAPRLSPSAAAAVTGRASPGTRPRPARSAARGERTAGEDVSARVPVSTRAALSSSPGVGPISPTSKGPVT